MPKYKIWIISFFSVLLWNERVEIFGGVALKLWYVFQGGIDFTVKMKWNENENHFV